MAAQRPGTVTAAAIIMIVTGILIVLPAAFLAGSVLASGNLGLSAASNPAAGLAELALILALIPLAIGILEIVAGAKVLSGKAWARGTPGLRSRSSLALWAWYCFPLAWAAGTW